MKIVIAYCSPAGSTRHIAQVIHKSFNQRNVDAVMLDLAKDHDYQPPEHAAEMKNKINTPWYIIPKNVDSKACTQCGICEEEYPVNAVALNPYPEFDLNCIDCFNCIRCCPEDAKTSSLSMDDIANHIRRRVRTINERPLTQVFL